MGPRPKLNNPLKTLSRLIKYMGKYYGIHMVIVVLCIIANVFASVNGTWFMKALVDEYILPMIKEGSNDFGPLLKAMIRVGGFYGVGVIASLIQAEIMVFVTQGTLKHLRDDMFNHMQGLPIKYFDTHSHGDIMSMYTNDIDTLRQMISQSMPQMFNSAMTIVSVFACMVALSIPLTLLTLIMIGVITLISVQERTKEIGILRAIGASKRDVSSMFNAETIIIGFTSGLLGVLVTYLLCIPINLLVHHLTNINNLRAILPIPAAIILIAISVLLTLIAGFIPSKSAAKKDPVVALRSE